jgi:hypothetical protein
VTGRWWSRRLLLGAGVVGAALVVGRLVETDIDPLRLALLTALVLAAWGLVVDNLHEAPTVWSPEAADDAVSRAQDPRTQRHLGVIESHLVATVPDRALGERLLGLADGTLRARHGVSLTDPDGRDRLGPEIVALLQDPTHRLTRSEIDRCVRRIESL